jgi:hypothetical protein
MQTIRKYYKHFLFLKTLSIFKKFHQVDFVEKLPEFSTHKISNLFTQNYTIYLHSIISQAINEFS